MVNVLGRVLTIEEVKQRMKDVRTAAVHYGGVVHAGERGRDEIVIVSARTWEDVTAEAQSRGPGADSRTSAYSVFDRALADGRIGRAPAAPAPRRRMGGVEDDNGLSVEEMVARAGADEKPARRRPA